MSAEAIVMAVLGFIILFGGTAFGLLRMGAESKKAGD